MAMYLTLGNASILFFEPSPMPDLFRPAKAVISIEMSPSSIPTMPNSTAAATHKMPPRQGLAKKARGLHALGLVQTGE